MSIRAPEPTRDAREQRAETRQRTNKVLETARNRPDAIVSRGVPGRASAKPTANTLLPGNTHLPETRRPNRSTVNFILDCVLAVAFVVLCTVAAIVQLVFPAPTVAAGWTVFGATIDQWITFQFGCLCVVAGGIILHVMLHWSWVCGMLTRGRPNSTLRTDDGIRTIVGVGVLIALLHVIGVSVLIAMLVIESP